MPVHEWKPPLTKRKEVPERYGRRNPNLTSRDNTILHLETPVKDTLETSAESFTQRKIRPIVGTYACVTCTLTHAK